MRERGSPATQPPLRVLLCPVAATAVLAACAIGCYFVLQARGGGAGGGTGRVAGAGAFRPPAGDGTGTGARCGMTYSFPDFTRVPLCSPLSPAVRSAAGPAAAAAGACGGGA